MYTPPLSLVIPLFNEAGNVGKLHEEISTVLEDYPNAWEIIFVNDGSRDSSAQVLSALFIQDPTHVRVITLRTNSGKALALQAGFSEAKGEYIFTMDADLQDDPEEIPAFIKKINEGYDLVSGWKHNRLDSPLKNTTSKFYNWITRKVSGIELRDFNCGFKLYRAETAKDLTLYGELHRYIPVMAGNLGYTIGEIPVNHRKRFSGSTKYGAIRFINGLLDLMTVMFITKYRFRPLHLFGYLGISFFGLGALGASYLTILKFATGASIGERPLLLFSVLLMIVGVQLAMSGLIAELMTSSSQRPKVTPPISQIERSDV